MRVGRRNRIALAALAGVAAAGAGQAQGTGPSLNRQADVVRYTMRKGDNLYTLADRYCLRLADYRAVQTLNHIPNPRRIPIGRVVTIPVALLRAEQLSARLVAARGTVQARAGQRDLPIAVGMALAPGTALETGANGLLTIELPNGSRTTLPTRSSLVIRQLRRFLLNGVIDYDLEVAAGKAETEATPIAPDRGQFRVRTQRAVSAVRGTRFRVGYGNEQSQTEVLDGTVAVGAERGTAQLIGQGFGAHVGADGAVTKAALLQPVELSDPGKVQIDPLVELALTPLPMASAYHVQIGADAGFVDVVADQTAAEPAVSFPDIGNGNWFVRATAISPDGLEGLYQTYAMKRRLTGLKASAEGDFSAMRFRWSGAGEGVRAYRFQMARQTSDALPLVDEAGLGPEGLELHNLDPGTYYWRVGVRQFADGDMTEKWLPYEKLIVAPGR